MKTAESVSNIRKGYRQGSVGAHTDSGMEFAHGRAEKTMGGPGSEMGKHVNAHTDGGMEGAKGRMNVQSEMGHSRGYDPTICRYERARQDGGMEHSRGKSQRSKGYGKSY